MVAQRLAFDERQRQQIAPFQPDQIECEEVRPLCSIQEFSELAAPVRLHADDLTVDRGIVRSNRVRDLLAEHRPACECVPVPRLEHAPMPADKCERAKSIVLHFERPIGMAERLGGTHKRHRYEGPHFRYARRRRRARNEARGGFVRGVPTVHSCAHKAHRQLSTNVPRWRVTFDTPTQTELAAHSGQGCFID